MDFQHELEVEACKASGKTDAIVNVENYIWDCVSGVLFVTESGGTVTDSEIISHLRGWYNFKYENNYFCRGSRDQALAFVSEKYPQTV